jgi:hypothetical protein
MIDDELLIAYADGECSDADRAKVEQALAEDPALRERLEQHRRLAVRLNAHFGPIAEAPVPDRLSALLHQQEADIVDFAAARESREKRRRLPSWGNWGAIAASLAVGVLAGQMALPGRGGIVESHQGALIARGDLAKALDTQLASAQDSAAAVRIGVSFQDRSGRYCRSFETGSLSGVGCREGDAWRLPITHASGEAAGQGGYRQAGSGDALVLETATQMMRDAPLDAIAEQKARDNGWH